MLTELSLIAHFSLGIAQWYLEQAQLIIEQDCLPQISKDTSDQKRPMNWIYVLKGIDQVEEDTHQNGMILYNIHNYLLFYSLLLCHTFTFLSF
jgi:hypothetical protein